MLARQLERGEIEVQNQYSRSARAAGNKAAVALVREVFEPCSRQWRGIGPIPQSGLRLRGGGVVVEDLEIGRADLEDVFLEIIGGAA